MRVSSPHPWFWTSSHAMPRSVICATKRFDVVAHEVELVMSFSASGWTATSDGRQAEDQPAVADVDVRQADDVAQELAIGVGVRAVDDGVRAGDHSWILSRRPPHPPFGHLLPARGEKGDGWWPLAPLAGRGWREAPGEGPCYRSDASACRAVAMSAAYRSGGAVSANRCNARRASSRCPARPSANPILNSASYCRGSTATARFHISTACGKSFSRA